MRARRLTRKLTREQLEQQIAYHEKQHMLYMCGLQYVMRGNRTQVCRERDREGNCYTYWACGETRADGGFVLVTFKPNSTQESDTRVSYIEDEYQHARDNAHCSEDSRRHYEAMAKVLVHRNKVQDQESNKTEAILAGD